MTLLESITLSIAVFGALLGVLNTIHTFDRDRIRVKVVPKLYFSMPGGVLTVSHFDKKILEKENKFKELYEKGEQLCLEITNMGYLPISISDVGFDSDAVVGRLTITKQNIDQYTKLPHRLEPRSSVMIYSAHHYDTSTLASIKNGYCVTDCGRRYKGRSPALRDLVKRNKINANQACERNA